MEVLQAAATSSDFFDKAAQAAAEMVGLDSVERLAAEGGRVGREAQQVAPRLAAVPAAGQPHILNKVRQRAKTLWDKPEARRHGHDQPRIGRRRRRRADPQPPGARSSAPSTATARSSARLSRQRGEITEVQAMLVELLAGGIAAGLDRLRHEQEASPPASSSSNSSPPTSPSSSRSTPTCQGRNSRGPPPVLRHPRLQPDQREARPGPRPSSGSATSWAPLRSVLDQRGVLVDYIGDELMAMWGAPTDQPDHASLACRAALEMLGQAPRAGRRLGARAGRASSTWGSA